MNLVGSMDARSCWRASPLWLVPDCADCWAALLPAQEVVCAVRERPSWSQRPLTSPNQSGCCCYCCASAWQHWRGHLRWRGQWRRWALTTPTYPNSRKGSQAADGILPPARGRCPHKTCLEQDRTSRLAVGTAGRHTEGAAGGVENCSAQEVAGKAVRTGAGTTVAEVGMGTVQAHLEAGYTSCKVMARSHRAGQDIRPHPAVGAVGAPPRAALAESDPSHPRECFRRG
mmetsp:Transcript_2814/g.4681  ORF Transcript_2814/g.4681 Transcript_2814/m.4681 type:complete len:229 (+) Transcript_2814:418-1104(+)